MSAELEPEEEKEPIKVSFSLPQLAGGALAAATAAAIGSTLGVAGTILGAAVASLVGAIGGTLYSAGIDRTHRKVTSVITRYGKDAPLLDADLPAGETVVDQVPVPAEPATIGPAGTGPKPDPTGRPGFWKALAITASVMFVAALVIITVVELGLGRALGGGDGTTVSQVVRPSKPSAKPTPSESPSTTEPATPTPEPATPTPSPSESTPTPTQPTTPAPEPTPEPTVTPSPAASEPPAASAPATTG